jgi:hypothetical protein
MIEKIKILLGEAASNYTDAQIELAFGMAATEVEEYTNRELDNSLEYIALQIAKIKLNRLNTEGLAAQSFSGISENYIDGYPAEIKAVLNRKRRVKLL